MPQVSIFLRHQDPARDSAPHRCSKTFAARLASAYPLLVAYNREKLQLRLLTKEAWSAVKARLRPKYEGVTAMTAADFDDLKVTVKDSGMSLMLSYPPAPQETDGRRRQRELWTRATNF